MPKRQNEIGIRLNDEAKGIYDNLPPKGKGEWVSQAIIEKRDRETGSNADIQQMRQEIDELRTDTIAKLTGRIEMLEKLVKSLKHRLERK